MTRACLSTVASALLLSPLLIVAMSCQGSDHGAAELPAIPGMAKSNNPDQPPPPVREFRAAWVATVGNIDWPSKSGLSSEQQKAEAIFMLDRAQEMNLNAIVLQVRTTADALYDSKIEPWSAFLTGTQGKAPDPYYDPLKFWIDQAHKRGIALHAWFNPFRTHYGGPHIEPAPSHVSVRRPDIAKEYGSMGWMDPGEPDAQDQSFRVFMDVVERYDVDGIHIDDYFYPYPETDKKTGKVIPFPDDPGYKKYTDAGGKLDRADWRRQNITHFIERVYQGIKKRKPHVQFGISPFGIPRPGLKGIEYVKGFDQYEKIYADPMLWLRKGWCDYIVPQLYWKIGAPHQPYLGLLQWWTHNNPKARNIYGGLFTSRIDESKNSWCPDEILGQIELTRLTPGADGNVHFSMVALDENRKHIGDLLRDGLYSQPALQPMTPWLGGKAPAAPSDVKFERLPAGSVEANDLAAATPDSIQSLERDGHRLFVPLTPPKTTTKEAKQGSIRVTWSAPAGNEKPFVYSVYYKDGAGWKMQVVPTGKTNATIPDDEKITVICVASVDRNGNESKRVVVSVRPRM